MKTAVACVVSAMLAIVGNAAVAQQAVSVASKQPYPTKPGRRTAPKRIPPVAAFLDQPVDAVNWDDVPFLTVVEWLREQNQDINVIVAWRSLESAGVERDSSISLRLRETTVGKVLAETLDQLSAGLGELRYQGVGDTLKISTRKHFNQKLYVRVYDVGDLILSTPDFIAPPLLGITDQPMGAAGGGGKEVNAGGPIPRRMDQLAEQIRNVVEPECWAVNGGRCSITVYQSNIIVRAPIEIHEIIGGPFILPE